MALINRQQKGQVFMKDLDPAIQREVDRQLKILEARVVEITPRDEFISILADSLTKNRPLRVKCGIDPTSPDVHLGHLVPYRKMRAFQDLGHTGVVIIGDYTAQIGDPSGKNESRPRLTPEKVKENARDYMEQVYTVLDPSKTEIRYQTEWFSDVALMDVLTWAAQTTVSKLIHHDTFKKRLDEGLPLGLHELFYPVLQGMDSVFIQADVELGATDQKFNVLMGRDYQKARGMRPQVAILLPIVTGLDGHLKMSKSIGNYVGVKDLPFDKFGKIMSVPDRLMGEYYTYIADWSFDRVKEISEGLANGQLHPNEVKKDLAQIVVSLFHGQDTGKEMREQFERVFKKKEIPDDVPIFKLVGHPTILEVLAAANMVESNGEARRLIQQGGLSFVGGEKIANDKLALGDEHREKVLKIGKRKFLKLI